MCADAKKKLDTALAITIACWSGAILMFIGRVLYIAFIGLVR
jgi:hypothetical protein